MANENKGVESKKSLWTKTKDWFKKDDGTLNKTKVAGVAVAGVAVVGAGGYAGYKMMSKKDNSQSIPVLSA
jgi:hypothetical protein